MDYEWVLTALEMKEPQMGWHSVSLRKSRKFESPFLLKISFWLRFGTPGSIASHENNVELTCNSVGVFQVLMSGRNRALAMAVIPTCNNCAITSEQNAVQVTCICVGVSQSTL